MPGKLNTNQIEEIAEDEIAQALKTLKKLQFKKGARFSVDSKGNTTKNYKDGGLAMAIEKVKAKEMELGGEAKPLVGGQKKLDKNKDGRISGDDFAMMEMGGKVQKYGGGGKVKGGKMSCRGMGAAIKGGGYTIS
jgi:hypothetical protein